MAALRYIQYSDYHAVVFRKKYPDIERTLIPMSMRYYKGYGGDWNDQKKVWRFPSGAMIRFCHLQHEVDVYDHQSAAYQFMGFDELPEFSKFQYGFMTSRVRGTNPNIRLMIRSAGNPIGKGKQWVKKKFIKGFDPMRIYRNPKTKTTQQFIPAFLEDNPTLNEGDPTYGDRLEHMDDKELARALRFGDWSGMGGQFFEDFWLEKNSKGYHRIAPCMPEQYDEIFASADWGYYPDAFSFHLHMVKNIKLPYASFWRVITFAELYGHKKHPAQWTNEIKEAERDFNVHRRYLDPSAFNKDPKGGSSVGEEFQNQGVVFLKANNDRRNGWDAMRTWLSEAPDGLPYWQITSNCKNLVNQVPELERDDHDTFDVKKGGEDHAADDARYFLISRPKNVIMPPAPVPKIAEKQITPMTMLEEAGKKEVIVGQHAVKK